MIDKTESETRRKQELDKTRRLVLIPVQAGCLTFMVAGIALVIGLWLDARLGTGPRWTLIILASSAPLTFVGIFLMIRQGLRGIKDTNED